MPSIISACNSPHTYNDHHHHHTTDVCTPSVTSPCVTFGRRAPISIMCLPSGHPCRGLLGAGDCRVRHRQTIFLVSADATRAARAAGRCRCKSAWYTPCIRLTTELFNIQCVGLNQRYEAYQQNRLPPRSSELEAAAWTWDNARVSFSWV